MKKFFTSVLLLAMAVSVLAAPRTVEEAAALAANFKNEQVSQKSGAHRAARKAGEMRLAHQVAKPNSTDPALFVFNNSNGGWVIVSADDNTREILAYSNKGSFDGSKINVAYMMDFYAERIAAVRPVSNEANARRAKRANESYTYAIVAPLLANNGDTIQWNQRAPYNNMCPMDPTDNTRSCTGCVATAAAQIMYFWKWPAHGMGGRTYSWHNEGGSHGRESVDFSAATYDWDNMLPQYHDGQYNETQANAVAQLMYHAGVSAIMEYGGEATEGSGTGGSLMAKAMHENFGYKEATHHDNWEA